MVAQTYALELLLPMLGLWGRGEMMKRLNSVVVLHCGRTNVRIGAPIAYVGFIVDGGPGVG